MSATVGKDWLTKITQQEGARDGKIKAYSLDDPRFLLRILTEERRVFRDALSHAEVAYASELREVGNKAHHDYGTTAFNEDDTSRALGTIVRLLRAVGATVEASIVEKDRADFDKLVIDRQMKRFDRQSLVVTGHQGLSLKGWREVVEPHDDVLRGDLDASQFMADIYNVHTKPKEAGFEYSDPAAFFARTFPTSGLEELLKNALRRLTGKEGANSVINLQTNFGGGKTHSMLALYHLCSGTPLSEYPQRFQELLDGADLATLGTKVRRVVIAGHELGPAEGVDHPDGVHTNTIWGEIAYQLGGKEAYDYIGESDARGVSPGAKFGELIELHSPCLILIDEWVTYARLLIGQKEPLPAGDFNSQFTFAQLLSESVAATPGALLALSIPASERSVGKAAEGIDIELGSADGRAAFENLTNAIRRVAKPWTPATKDESFEIVQQRLFKPMTGEQSKDAGAVAKAFTDYYLSNQSDFPATAPDFSYHKRIRTGYPIHPELFDQLYATWGSLPTFQRTRGVLRLLATIVRSLYEAKDGMPLIQPGTVPLGDPRVRTEFVSYLSPVWHPIIDSDIEGRGAKAVEIDKEKTSFGKKETTLRIARTIFIGSAPNAGQPDRRGIEDKSIALGAAVPDDTPAHFDSALQKLAQQATYLYPDGHRYWFGTEESVAKKAAELAERLNENDVWAEIYTRLDDAASATGLFKGVHIIGGSADLPDYEQVRIAILKPQYSHRKGDLNSTARTLVEDALFNRGEITRANKNLVVFLAADRNPLDELSAATRAYLAWNDISTRIKAMNLPPDQQEVVTRSKATADRTVKERLGRTYTWVLYASQPQGNQPAVWKERLVDDPGTTLLTRVSDYLVRAGALSDLHSPRNITQALGSKLPGRWESKGHLSAAELWDLYREHVYMPRLTERKVLYAAIGAVQSAPGAVGWDHDGFALATGYDGTRYEGLFIPLEDSGFGHITDDTLIVRPDVALAQHTAEHAGMGLEDQADPASGEGTSTAAAETSALGSSLTLGKSGAAGAVTSGTLTESPLESFFGKLHVEGNRYGKPLRDLQEYILDLLMDADTSLEIDIEIKACRRGGFDATTRRNVEQNASEISVEAEFE